jgi:hypothetical protein
MPALAVAYMPQQAPAGEARLGVGQEELGSRSRTGGWAAAMLRMVLRSAHQ